MGELPIIDISGLSSSDPRDATEVARAMDEACRTSGFFYITPHGGYPPSTGERDAVSRRFFALDNPTKAQIGMARGGRAWRGWFPLGDELTSGRPDCKEGLYFGVELPDGDPRVMAKTPMHGANLFPREIPEMRDAVLKYTDAMTGLGHRLMRGLALGLGLDAAYFDRRYTRDPLILFRVFRYPPLPSPDDWSVGAHTDYGLLTILAQDDSGGLEVHTDRGWQPAPPVDAAYLCNIGDMLDRMTGGRYRSTLHRVRNASDHDRLSFPFFFDPSFDAAIAPILRPGADDANTRWDGVGVHDFEGTYGDYLVGKVSKVFPQLVGELD